MKILLIVDDYLPYSIKIAAKMIHELALQMNAGGHEAWVLTPFPDQKKKMEIKTIEGVHVIYFRNGKIKNTNKIRRAINELSLSFNAWHAAGSFFKKNRFDGIVNYSPTIFWGLLVNKLQAIWRCNSYLVLRDIFPQWTVDNGILKKQSPIYWYFKFFEWYNYRTATRIGLMSPSNLAFFKTQYQDVSKFEVLYNWSTVGEIPLRTTTYREKFNLGNKIVLFYGGNIGHAQNMIYLINLAKRFRLEEQVHFLFVGKGDEVDLILKEKSKHNLTNITYLSAVDQKTYFEMLNEFDIGLFSLHPDHRTHNFPGKILGYMAYAKPILGCVNKGNDLKDIVNDANAGIVVNSGEEALVEAAEKLIASEKVRKEMGENGRALLRRHFSVESACNNIVKVFAD